MRSKCSENRTPKTDARYASSVLLANIRCEYIDDAFGRLLAHVHKLRVFGDHAIITRSRNFATRRTIAIMIAAGKESENSPRKRNG